VSTNGGHGLDHHWIDPKSQQPCISDHQRGAATIAGFAPERLAAAQVGVDLLQPAALGHPGNRHLRRRTMQPFGQRQGEVFGGAGRPRRG